MILRYLKFYSFFDKTDFYEFNFCHSLYLKKRLKLQEHSKRQGINERIEDHVSLLERKKKTLKEKNEDFLKLKQKHEEEVQELIEQKANLQTKRIKSNEEVLKIQKDIADQEKYYQDIINDLNESLANIKKKTNSLEINTQTLDEEFRILNKALEKKEEETKLQEVLENEPEIKKKPTGGLKRNSTIMSSTAKRNSIVSPKKG